MIQGLSGQRKSPGPHLRDWGCKVYCLLAMVQDKLGTLWTPEQIRQATIKGIKAGHILDNNLPVDGSKGEWWRVFVKAPAAFVDMASGLQWTELARSTSQRNWPHPYDYLEIEWATRQGSHFGLGQFDNQGRVVTVFDPWPEVARHGIRSIRFIKLEAV
jgi:hypothetical protein